jgi:tetratricopeptide (TPR) repeat protein
MNFKKGLEFMRTESVDQLLDLEDHWMNREIIEEGEARNAWIEEGIDLYKKFLHVDRKNHRYSIMLADLYLKLGRDAKMRQGNRLSAYETLRRATLYSSATPDAFYHLSFLLANENRKWEAVVFYGKEAMEIGIAGPKRIKLLCNLGLGYSRLGYSQKGMELIDEAKRLDEKGEYEWFIELYWDQINLRIKEPIILKGPNEKRKSVSKRDSNILKEEAMDGKCVVLDLTANEKYFYGISDSVRLEPKQAELLGYLIDHQKQACPKKEIEDAIWLDDEVGPTTVKRYISGIRGKLSQAMGIERNTVENSVLLTAFGGYEWKASIPAYVLR